MSRAIARVGALAIAIAVAPFSGGGCASADSMLFIRQVQAIMPPACTATTDSTLFIASGLLDVALRTEYTGILLLGNQLVGRGSADLVRTETSRIVITLAEVQVQDSAGQPVSAFSVPVTGFVDPLSGSQPGLGLVDVPLIDSQTGQNVAAELQGHRSLTRRMTSLVRLKGQTLGGTKVESNQFQFSVTLCYGCSIDFPSSANEPTSKRQPNCDKVDTSMTTSSMMSSCTPGQDSRVDCRQCRSVSDACRYPLEGTAGVVRDGPLRKAERGRVQKSAWRQG